ncbi:MAG: hypothetical protein AABW71_00235 [Nanoarchaeota archaeon]
MESKAISDTGPVIHLNEINLTSALDVFSSIFIPLEVSHELQKYKINLPKKIKVRELEGLSKDIVKILTNEYDLDIGESCAISLALQEKADYFLTDDLEARETAKKYKLEVHGTVGIILRAFKEKIIDRKTAITRINDLHEKSTLFITKDLIKNIIEAIESF